MNQQVERQLTEATGHVHLHDTHSLLMGIWFEHGPVPPFAIEQYVRPRMTQDVVKS